MEWESELCSVEITVDEMYTVDSTDNRPYDRILNPFSYKHSDRYKAFSIEISNILRKTKLVVIGDFYSCVTDGAVLEGKVLTLLLNDCIFQIDVSAGSLLRTKKLECFGCNCGIFKVKEGYIIFGELEIRMLDFDLHKKWVFSGKDSFVSAKREKVFELGEESIKVWDVGNHFYEVDYLGRILKEL